ncbi:blue light receptor, partial [Irineochytrium annulatum]
KTTRRSSLPAPSPLEEAVAGGLVGSAPAVSNGVTAVVASANAAAVNGIAGGGVGNANGNGNGNGASSAAKKCSNCSTSTTPMWRKGPMGAATLCNACGVKWRKNAQSLTLH